MNPFKLSLKYPTQKKSAYTPEHLRKMEEISNRYGKDFLMNLAKLYKAIAVEEVNMPKIDTLVKTLQKLRKKQKNTYLRTLLYPEKSKNVRVPSNFPIPSHTLQQTDFITITTNVYGNFQIEFSPQVFFSSVAGEVYVNNGATLDGNTLLGAGTYTNTSVLLNNFASSTYVNSFRLVSACMIISYFGAIQDQKGRLGGCIDFVPTSGSLAPTVAFSQFNAIDDKIFSQVVSTNQGLKVNFFPKDPSDLNFIKSDTAPASNFIPSKVTLLAYGQGLPASSPCVRVDFIKNLEIIPAPAIADLLDMEHYKDMEGDIFDSTINQIVENNLAINSLSEAEALYPVVNCCGDDLKEILDVLKTNPNMSSEEIRKLSQVVKKKNDTISTKYLFGDSYDKVLIEK